LLTGKALS